MSKSKELYARIENIAEQNGQRQIFVLAMEEMSELIKELSKAIRGEGDVDNIIEEIADVEIMINQICANLEITDEELLREIEKKISRTEKLLNI